MYEHIDSAHDEQTLAVLLSAAERYIEEHCLQPSLLTALESPARVVDL